MELKKIFVIGAGTMGNGIAQTAAVAGYDVTMMDIAEEALNKGKATIGKSVGKFLAKDKITQAQHDAAISIQTETEMDAISEADLVIEAATENPELKFKIFADMDKFAKPGVLLASNTSSISLTKLAAATTRPELVVGMHFFNPVPLMKLLEVVRGLQTSDDTVNQIVEIGKTMGKEPVVAKDSPGFVSNRILCPMINEAIYTLYEGVGTVEGIDSAMRLGANHRMGPLQLADFIGLDTCLAIMQVLYEGLADTKYRPCPLLVKYVEAGWLGRKAGRGFYDYQGEKPVPTR